MSWRARAAIWEPLYALANQQDKAAAIYQEGLDILQPLAAKFPKHAWYATSLAALRINLAGLWQTQNREKKALEQYDLTLAALDDVLHREPNHAEARNNLIPAHGGRATTLARMHRYDEALKDWDKLLELTTAPGERRDYRVLRAHVLVQAGKLGEAASEADAIAEAEKTEAVYWYEAGCLHAEIAAAGQIPGPGRTASEQSDGVVSKEFSRLFQTATNAGHLRSAEFVCFGQPGFQALFRKCSGEAMVVKCEAVVGDGCVTGLGR